MFITDASLFHSSWQAFSFHQMTWNFTDVCFGIKTTGLEGISTWGWMPLLYYLNISENLYFFFFLLLGIFVTFISLRLFFFLLFANFCPNHLFIYDLFSLVSQFLSTSSWKIDAFIKMFLFQLQISPLSKYYNNTINNC